MYNPSKTRRLQRQVDKLVVHVSRLEATVNDHKSILDTVYDHAILAAQIRESVENIDDKNQKSFNDMRGAIYDLMEDTKKLKCSADKLVKNASTRNI